MAIKSFELEPNKENLLRTLTEDMLNRNESVWHFARLCDAQDGSCSIAIEAKWGAGKTFFVRHTQLLIESFNSFTNAVTDGDKIVIKNAFSKYVGKGENAIELEPEVCVYYDAWSNDSDGDPILLATL